MNAQLNIQVGQVIVDGSVTKVLSFGALVEVAKDGEGDKAKPICGLLHVTEILGRTRPDREAALAALKEGDKITVKVTNIELPQEQPAEPAAEGEKKADKPSGKVKIALSQRAVQREKTMSGLSQGTLVTGTVISKTDFGAFLQVGEGVDGLLHVSQFNGASQDERTANLEALELGTQVEVEVVKITVDEKGTKVALSQKSIARRKAVEVLKGKVNEQVSGTVTSVVPYGIFVQVGEGVDGLLHVSALSGDNQAEREERRDSINAGDSIEVVIDSVEEQADGKVRIALSE